MNIENRIAKLESTRTLDTPCSHPPEYATRFIMPDGTINEHCARCGKYGPKDDLQKVAWGLGNVPTERLIELRDLFRNDPEAAQRFRNRLISEGVITSELIK